jgi:prepilin-type N-terminal cleavage/methylation domain-containing protein
MKTARHSSRAFTLIEIMVVVGIMGIILAMGIPSIIRVLKREGMRKAVNDVVEVCSNARARAILSGQQTEVVFYPLEGRFSVGGSSSAPAAGDSGGISVHAPSPSPAGSGLSGQLPDEITIEMLDINLLEYKESDSARIHFYPNGTSDEMTLVLHSTNEKDQKDAWQKVWLEVTTGLADWGPVQ